MNNRNINCVVVLGPTASGKTTLGVRIAQSLQGEVVSADSRQVYVGLDIGSGKDLDEYVVQGQHIPYHLIDIVTLDEEFSVFDYQRAFFQIFEELQTRGVMPVVVGGTGLYLDAILKGYRMVEVPENPALRASLEELSQEALVQRLAAAKEAPLHNTTDTEDRDRLIRAIEIAEYSRGHEPEASPELRPLVLGTRWPRPELRRRITQRLRERLNTGMIEEVKDLLDSGIPEERLERLGLEYRFVTQHLKGDFDREGLFEKLNIAIRQFAKRQETWFRRMERQGTVIHWVDRGRLSDPAQLKGLLR